VVDALRYDRLSLSGYARETTPHLKRLAQRGVVFDRAYSTGSNTMTAIPPLLTGVYPGEASHRLRSQEDANGLAATFLAAGYRTAAFQGNVWLRPKAGFGEGFDSYRLIGKQTPGPTLHDQALQWLRERAATPFFLFIQTFDVHSPYNPPPPFRGRFAPQTDAPTPELTFHPAHWDDSVRAFWNTQVRKLEPDLYDDCIAFADHEIGRLVTTLDELGLRESTIVIVTADHGESLGEGGRYLHGFSVHEEQIRIPLVILLPWADGPHRRELLVSLIDVGPTLLELTGLPVPPHFQGVSLTRMEKDWPARVAIGRNTTHWFVRDGGWKLVADRRAPAQLFDLRTDSTEQRNVAAQFPVRSQYLTAVLCEHSRSYRDPKVDLLSPDAQLDEDVQRRMRKALRALATSNSKTPGMPVGAPTEFC
jgi:arylsulfatase A-like enzyme